MAWMAGASPWQGVHWLLSILGLLTACLMQERRYDASRGMSLLVEDWVSRASALQRKGRAGAPVIDIFAHAPCSYDLPSHPCGSLSANALLQSGIAAAP